LTLKRGLKDSRFHGMPEPTARELKKTLIQEGFEVYRTEERRVLLADRVRDNLIMDACVSASIDSAPIVQFVVRAKRTDFPSEPDDQLYERARKLATEGTARGYAEVRLARTPVQDPGHSETTIDTWFEVVFERSVPRESLAEELRFALGVTKEARP
jgi:hypothetical protein